MYWIFKGMRIRLCHVCCRAACNATAGHESTCSWTACRVSALLRADFGRNRADNGADDRLCTGYMQPEDRSIDLCVNGLVVGLMDWWWLSKRKAGALQGNTPAMVQGYRGRQGLTVRWVLKPLQADTAGALAERIDQPVCYAWCAPEIKSRHRDMEEMSAVMRFAAR